MIIKRKKYLDKLIGKKDNGLVKVITGVRRCGKSYLMSEIYHAYLNSIGIDDDHIIEIALDEAGNARYRNPLELDSYIRRKITDTKSRYYVLIDEIQKMAAVQNPYINYEDSEIGFVDVVLGLMRVKNIDLYITGSNSKMLSSDILTEFRGRGDEIRVNPLTFKDFYDSFNGEKRYAWNEYYTYGGMPLIMSKNTHEDKSAYLKDLFSQTYLNDVIERNKIANDKDVLEELLNIISSSIGSLTNPTKLSNTFKSVRNISIKPETIRKYLDYFVDAFILGKSLRYDIKGKKYIDTPLKYYFTDVGLRNARLNFRQQEENHIMENVLYNELAAREFDIDVGVVEYNHKDKSGKKVRTQLEIDFVANKGSKRYYIQSAFSINEENKKQREVESLNRVADSFKKIIVVKDPIVPWHDDNGILYIGIEQFLLEEHSIDF